MTKREAKRVACRAAALILEHCADNDWMDRKSRADTERLQDAWDDLLTELHRRGPLAPLSKPGSTSRRRSSPSLTYKDAQARLDRELANFDKAWGAFQRAGFRVGK